MIHHWWCYWWGHGRIGWHYWGITGSEPIWVFWAAMGFLGVLAIRLMWLFRD